LNRPWPLTGARMDASGFARCSIIRPAWMANTNRAAASKCFSPRSEMDVTTKQRSSSMGFPFPRASCPGAKVR
jgi:hypothetical protein